MARMLLEIIYIYIPVFADADFEKMKVIGKNRVIPPNLPSDL